MFQFQVGVFLGHTVDYENLPYQGEQNFKMRQFQLVTLDFQETGEGGSSGGISPYLRKGFLISTVTVKIWQIIVMDDSAKSGG